MSSEQDLSKTTLFPLTPHFLLTCGCPFSFRKPLTTWCYSSLMSLNVHIFSAFYYIFFLRGKASISNSITINSTVWISSLLLNTLHDSNHFCPDFWGKGTISHGFDSDYSTPLYPSFRRTLLFLIYLPFICSVVLLE